MTFSEGLRTVMAISLQYPREQPSAATLKGPTTNWFSIHVLCVVVVLLLIIIYFRKQVLWIRKMGLIRYYPGTVITKECYPMWKKVSAAGEKQNYNDNKNSEKRVWRDRLFIGTVTRSSIEMETDAKSIVDMSR